MVVDYIRVEMVGVDRILFRVCVFDYKYLKHTDMWDLIPRITVWETNLRVMKIECSKIVGPAKDKYVAKQEKWQGKDKQVETQNVE